MKPKPSRLEIATTIAAGFFSNSGHVDDVKMNEHICKVATTCAEILIAVDNQRPQKDDEAKPQPGHRTVAVLAAVERELSESQVLAEGMIGSEKLAGNVVKTEYWKGEQAALTRIGAAIGAAIDNAIREQAQLDG